MTLTWTLSLLLNNRATLEKVQEELDVHVGKERLVTESDLDKLEYLQAFIKESMRLSLSLSLSPAIPINAPLEFSEDCIIGGYNIWKLQRDPKVWSIHCSTHRDIDVKGHHFELLPFGSGRRVCPGAAFTVQITQLVPASFLQAFEISTPENVWVDMTVSPGLSALKTTPLEIIVKTRLASGIFEQIYDL